MSVGSKRHYVVTQDEACFHPNDDSVKKWHEDGKEVAPPKDRDTVVIASDCVCAELGAL